MNHEWCYYTKVKVYSSEGSIFILSSPYSGVFSTGAMGAMAPVILRKRLIAPAVSTRNGKILLTLGTRNIKILNTPIPQIFFISLQLCLRAFNN